MVSKRLTYRIAFFLAMSAVISACRPDPAALAPTPHDPPYAVELPQGFPPLPVPEDNALTQSRVELGKRLFFDSRLSSDGMISCASCHLPENAFSDPRQVSLGVHERPGFRNSPTLANVAYQPRLFMDGGVPNLEMQILAPFDEHSEFDLPIDEAAERLLEDFELIQLSQMAYNRDPDPFVITRALSAYQRTLISGQSAYDRYINGDAFAMSPDAIAGMELFFSSKTDCSACHSGVFLTDFSYQNIGLYEAYSDYGRERVTADPNDRGKFKVPTLRNVAVTAPYMHDGSLSTLQEVVAHFNAGGGQNELQHPAVRPLHLTENEQAQLVAFLEALTDETFINNSEHRP